MSPQQSSRSAHSTMWHCLPVPMISKFDGWQVLLAQATPTGQPAVTMQDSSSSQSAEESQDEPRSPSTTAAAPPLAPPAEMPPLGCPPLSAPTSPPDAS